MQRTLFWVPALALACATSSADQQSGARRAQRAAWTETETVRGSVDVVSPRSMTVRSDQDGVMQLQLTEATIVNLDGEKAAISAIRTGSDVSASYGVLDRRMMAVRLEVKSNHPADMPRHAQPSSREGK